jgi:hypothetical protein
MITTAPLSIGPRLDTAEKGVHIIKLVPTAALAEVMNATPTDAQLTEACLHVGKPAPTDIVVFDHQPWHVVNGQLKAHPQVHIDHPETILTISFSARERPVWWSEEPFTIKGIQRSHHGTSVAGSPDYPFDAGVMPLAAQAERDLHGRPVFVARATTILKASVGQTYKINFSMGEDIDPDMSCSP